jgi:type I restriction enzyme M protein
MQDLTPMTNLAEVATLTEKATALEREARELEGKAQAVEDAAYDLKAVNPNAKNNEDTRTSEELLDLIEAKGKEVAEALKALRTSLR